MLDGGLTEEIHQFRRALDEFLHVRILAVEDAQRIGMQAALGIGIQRLAMPLEISDQLGAVALPLLRAAQRVDFQPDAGERQLVPESRTHDDLLGIDIRPGIAESLDTELVKLAVAPFLRPFVAEHRAGVPQALRTGVQQAVLQHGAHAGGGALRAQRQRLAVERIDERIHFLLDDVRHLADGAGEERRRLDHRHAYRPVAVGTQPAAHGIVEALPQLGLVGQDVVHPANRLNRLAHR